MIDLTHMGRRVLSLVGASLSLGAPGGWLIIRWIQGVHPMAEIQANPLLMVYLLGATMVAFVVTGFFIGLQWEKLCEANQALKELSWRDALTGLPNARRFWEDVQNECLRAIRTGKPLHLLAIDLDHFKSINDTYGHLVGDEVLKAAAQAMSEVMREDEGVYRVGGEEFSAILVNATPEQALQVGERLRAAIESMSVLVGEGEAAQKLNVTASVGVAGRKCKASREVQEIYEWADEALYEAKGAGRNRVVPSASKDKIRATVEA
ncbi:MAG: GGDEF domain-containing protein [Bradymonadaceae bacterium]